jgi:hypothetical protein
MARVIDHDAEAFGVPRATLITALLRQSSGYGLFRSDALEAFALCRRFGRGHVVGPVVASCDADAIAIVAPPFSNTCAITPKLCMLSGPIRPSKNYPALKSRTRG